VEKSVQYRTRDYREPTQNVKSGTKHEWLIIMMRDYSKVKSEFKLSLDIKIQRILTNGRCIYTCHVVKAPITQGAEHSTYNDSVRTLSIKHRTMSHYQ
jgi:hypothetical protein